MTQRPNMAALENMEVKKGSHGPRYCKNCNHYKPPRGSCTGPLHSMNAC